MKKITQEELINKAKELHDNFYSYEKTILVNTKTNIIVTCPNHGDFVVNPLVHLRGTTKCPSCKAIKLTEPKENKTLSFIERSKKIHGNEFDYSLVQYVSNHNKVKIICKKHGEFETTPAVHKQGFKCPKCKYGGIDVSEKTETFVNKAKQIHLARNYDYSLVEYKYNTDKIKIICPEHGEFIQIAQNHLNGQKCPKCALSEGSLKQQKPFKEFEKEHQKINGFDYKLDESSYNGSIDKITLNCNIHGLVEQRPNTILRGKPCPICNVENQKSTLEEILMQFKEIHGKKYDYSLVEYFNFKTKMKIICPKHGIFEQNALCHITAQSGCPSCAHTTSKFEEWVGNVIEVASGVKPKKYKMQNRKDIDVVYNNVGFEANGLLFHCEGLLVDSNFNVGKKDSTYHLNKTNQAKSEGIKLYHIFEDEYKLKNNIVKNKILNACGFNNSIKAHARKCFISEISMEDCSNFLDNFHIQGADSSGIRYGAWLDGENGSELVGVMTFKLKDEVFELNRYATNFKYHVRGLASKMLSHFINLHNPKKITTFADIRWTPDGENNMYTKIGFKLIEQQKPVYHYYNKELGTKRFNRMRFQKHKILEKYGDIEGINDSHTEKELMILLGYDRIWDCGNWKFEMIL